MPDCEEHYYCPEHRYNPPANSGLAFCPYCEAGADLTAAEYAELHGPEWYEEEAEGYDPTICHNCGAGGFEVQERTGEYVCQRCGDTWNIYEDPEIP